ncbi:MAG TPA: hypothetical protein VFZ25_04175, partial [Chloroflexota bacterium]|nr:hypothetical protein [Chloroflexota bacterium]
NLNANTTQAQFQDLLQMATRVNQFATAWIALQTARAGAGSYRRWKRRATWNNVVGSIVGIGQLIIQNNAATFNNRRQAVINLTGQY